MQSEQKNCFTEPEILKSTVESLSLIEKLHEDNTLGEPFDFPPHCSTFQPDIWKVMKDDVYFSIECIERALEYAKQCLRYSETSHKDNPIMYKCFETKINHDINLMEKTLTSLRKYGSKDEYFPSSKETK